MKRFSSTFFEATAVMVGTVIGAGILGIPFVFAHAGFLTGVLSLLGLTIVALIMHLMLADVVDRTKGIHQLTGYANQYLGSRGKFLMMGAMMVSIYGALVAYTIGIGESLAALTRAGTAWWWGIGFFLFAGGLVFIGLSIIKRFELWMTMVIFAAVIALGIAGGSHIEFQSLNSFVPHLVFLPYGTILFALLGTVAVPEAARVLRTDRKHLRKAVAFGIAAPAVVYLLFALVVVGITGALTTEVATVGLGERLGTWAQIIGNIFAIFAMGTSFLTLGLAMQDMYHYDFKLSHVTSWLLALAPPLFIYLLGLTSFVETLGIAGGVAGSIEGILIVAMYRKIRPRNPISKIAAPVLVLVFLGGLIWTVWKIFGSGI